MREVRDHDILRVCEMCSILPQAKDDIVASFLELVVKLNENTFKPVFRKLFDWAFSASSGESIPARIVYKDVILSP